MKRIGLVATFALVAVAGCALANKTVTESVPVQEAPKTYLAASGTDERKYLNQNIPVDKARFVVVKGGSGAVEEVLIGTSAGSHWNIKSCSANKTYSHLYSVNQDGSKDTQYAGVKEGKYCHIGYGKDGEVAAVSVTEDATETDPVKGFNACPPDDECNLYTVKSKWVSTADTELTPNDKDMSEIDGYWERERANDAQESFDRKWAEGEVEDLKKACRMGQKHWTLCPDGYDKR